MKTKPQSRLQELLRLGESRFVKSEFEQAHPIKRHRVLAMVSATLLAFAGGLQGQGQFPANPGLESFPTSSPFYVTIHGVPYSAFLTDPRTTVTFSGVTTEGTETNEPVCVLVPAGFPDCKSTVSDQDVGCFPPGLGGPNTRRELHTEILSLNLCSETLGGIGTKVCYLAGQPAADALKGRPAEGMYHNSCGELVSRDGGGNPANDFPAQSFWAMHGVVKIEPAPPGTSGVFYMLGTILMNLPFVTSLPPVGSFYTFSAGNTDEDGGGVACGGLPIPLYDAGEVGAPPPPSPEVVGMIECPARHLVDPTPRIIKWLQPPDLTSNGLDVLASSMNILADDFRCTNTGPISDIHIWGSWLNDQRDTNAQFCVGIWSDVPGMPSHPGALLWSECFSTCQYLDEPFISANEQFFDPNLGQIIGTDTNIWLYSFVPTNAFTQNQGTIYWLSVRAITSSNFLFGWKTSSTNFQDDAVLGHVDGAGQPLGDWVDLHYPPPDTNKSINLAFSLTTLPSTGPNPSRPTIDVATVSSDCSGSTTPSIIFSWHPKATGFKLELTSSLGTNASWYAVPGSWNVNQMSFPINPTSSATFFRLRSP